MSGYQLPGPLCRFLAALEIDSGTLCRGRSGTPGPVSAIGTSPRNSQGTAKAAHAYVEHRGVVKDPLSNVDEPVILNAHLIPQCAELVKKLASAPQTVPDRWQRGISLTAGTVVDLEIGTPIATGWDSRGFYPNNPTGQHSGIFAGSFKDKSGKVIGFTIVEQYSGLATIQARVVYFDPRAAGKKDTYFYRGGDYATIKW